MITRVLLQTGGKLKIKMADKNMGCTAKAIPFLLLFDHIQAAATKLNHIPWLYIQVLVTLAKRLVCWFLIYNPVRFFFGGGRGEMPLFSLEAADEKQGSYRW